MNRAREKVQYLVLNRKKIEIKKNILTPFLWLIMANSRESIYYNLFHMNFQTAISNGHPGIASLC
ncbi:hypothetical protein DERF_002068 [Dermatophagoides farinae]|uniref:Uncharacterized protein n=1 Tax=Dermatophagoides farinae TaxID=6954 RepID=A0A922I9W0_DERFA|nr:hypothetical protein DERF_002068 [Dermatophagoides farinae]